MTRIASKTMKRIVIAVLVAFFLYSIYNIVYPAHDGACCSIPITKLAVRNGLGGSDIEAFSNLDDSAGIMGGDIPKSVTYSGTNQTPDIQYPPVPPTGETLDMLNGQTFRPDCCPTAYSTSEGCACLSDAQLTFLSDRGGNRSSE